jgi:histidine triad (HIT) family protein
MKNCIFCKIPKGEKILETRYSCVILDKYPVSQGHILVVPKRHYENITQIPDNELFDIIKTIKIMEKRLIEKLKAKGVDLRQNYRPFVPESKLRKGHIHFHLIPRSFEDLVYKQQGKAKRSILTKTEKELLIKKLK